MRGFMSLVATTAPGLCNPYRRGPGGTFRHLWETRVPDGENAQILPPNSPMFWRQLGEIPKCGTAQPTIFWNAGAATDPP
jgi:hypothetical protein